MELSSCLMPTLIHDDCLCPESWRRIGSGGFGQIYRTKHTKWGIKIAIKLLHCKDSSASALLREADLMRHGGNPNVLRILGVYKGHPPEEASTQLGLVMEYMERGSLADLQRALNGPPPWALAFRITHQIALGMNFLHQLDPPLLHLDLKPSNVLLDDSLNAKLTDFGLAKVAQSASRMARERDEETGGTTSYMPPEAFQLSSYTPSFSSDIYSYGILLWSVITGKEPYDSVISSLVRFRIPEGDRPDLTSVDSSQAAGLSELVELMQHCWDDNPKQRPSFMDCIKVTTKVYTLHKKEVHDDVCAVQKKLDDKDKVSSGLKSLHITSKTQNGCVKENSHYSVKTEPTPVQATGSTANSRPKEPETFACQRAPTSSGTNHKPAAKAPPTTHRPPMTQRQYSTPGNVSISLSNVTGVQIGNNNYMNIYVPHQRQRQRHPTAPSHFNLPSSHQPSKYQQNSQHKP
ncbi:LOW QUALITY PROTEIN: receptor-interacting serine/threonine-protein kinase 3 [Colossoma macropomum]|uniref:LOW QUALITY PROTEIN: receptor-interacting serine/threonine-protein kinase 3 n=1 Tax=Colossoma macropomum TaxID=42526 RepID=UPI001863F187|nr:LOW QUALITY PROTEIN: receptor-interacting serine/threonine-protein kinase 3 [Colossoma macropomum]